MQTVGKKEELGFPNNSAIHYFGYNFLTIITDRYGIIEFVSLKMVY